MDPKIGFLANDNTITTKNLTLQNPDTQEFRVDLNYYNVEEFSMDNEKLVVKLKRKDV